MYINLIDVKIVNYNVQTLKFSLKMSIIGLASMTSLQILKTSSTPLVVYKKPLYIVRQMFKFLNPFSYKCCELTHQI